MSPRLLSRTVRRSICLAALGAVTLGCGSTRPTTAGVSSTIASAGSTPSSAPADPTSSIAVELSTTSVAVLGGGRPPLTPLTDQTPPVGLNGITFDRDRLWVADYEGAQLLGVDSVSGRIVSRYGKADGLSSAPDDVAVGPDGSIYWTGYDTGEVGRIRFDEQGSPAFDVVGNVGAGANPIAFADDGKLYVGRIFTGDGLYEIDPTGAKPARRIVETLGNVNGFDVAPDGRIYGPKFGGAPDGSLVRINPVDGSVEEVTRGFSLPLAVKVSLDGKSAFVVEAGPPARVAKVDLATGTSATLVTVTATLLDNLTLAPDGSIFVTLGTGNKIVVIGPDGSTQTTLTVGTA